MSRPIFVVGFQRSGTTLLQSLLGSHAHIAAPPETYFVFRIVRLAARYGDLADDDNLRRAVHDALHPPLDLFDVTPADEERVFERARKDRTLRGLFDAMMSDFADEQGKSRWSDKSPGQRASDVLDLFPEAQVIHIVRDPRDVIASSLATPWTRADAFSLARQWKHFTLANIRRGLLSGPERFLQIRYEDLTRNPAAMLNVVFAFLQESFDETLLSDVEGRRRTVAEAAAPWQRRVLDPISPAVEGTWQQRLSRRSRAGVQAILHRELVSLGYAPVPSRTILAGRIVAAPSALRDAARTFRLRRVARDPRRIESEIRKYLEEQSRTMREIKN